MGHQDYLENKDLMDEWGNEAMRAKAAQRDHQGLSAKSVMLEVKDRREVSDHQDLQDPLEQEEERVMQDQLVDAARMVLLVKRVSVAN